MAKQNCSANAVAFSVTSAVPISTLHFCLAGEARVSFGPHEVLLHPEEGNIFCVPGNIKYSGTYHKHFSCIHINCSIAQMEKIIVSHPELAYLKEHLQHPEKEGKLHRPVKRDFNSRCLLDNIRNYNESLHGPPQFYLNIQVEGLINWYLQGQVMLDNYENLSSDEQKRKDILSYASNHLDAEDLRRDIARHACLSHRALIRLFEAEEVKLDEHIKVLKMEAAKNYLTTTDDAMDTIAAKIGYADRVSFSKAFEAFTGHWPKAYRTKYRNGSL
jgi:AraC-like DNA-binding protein